MNLFPAILVGGPPHSGKSVLCYSLSRSLRERGLAHYLLRAAPDGEGDWANEIDPGALKDIRVKHGWSDYWVNVTRRDVARRTLPLLVDVGGLPTPDQETIFDQCTHAIVLAAADDDRRHWRSLARSHSLILLADLQSALAPAAETPAGPADQPLTGVLHGLARGQRAAGPVYEALAARVAELLSPYDQDTIRRAHFAGAPFLMAPVARPEDGGVSVIDLDELARGLHPGARSPRFDPQSDIGPALARIPSDRPIALYGRMPAPLAAAIAARRDVRWQFDARLGWVQPPRFPVLPADAPPRPCDAPVGCRLSRSAAGANQATLAISIRDGYLDYEEARDLALPYVAPELELTIDGKIPFWLLCGLARAYRQCAGVTARYVPG